MIPQSTKPWRWLHDFTQVFWNSKYDERESGSVVIAKGILKNLYAHVEIEWTWCSFQREMYISSIIIFEMLAYS